MIRLLAISIVIVIIFSPGCIRKRPPLISIETYEFHCRNLTDNALIAEFYRVDMELQNAIDRAWRLERALPILPRRSILKVKELRMQRAIVLTIIHQRGLTLPLSAK